MLRRQTASIVGVLCTLALLAMRPVNAQDTGGLRRLLNVREDTTSGWGGSAVANLGSFHFNGDYGVFSAGAGFGVSYKFESLRRAYRNEIGLYAGPQFSSTDNKTAASVSAMVQYTFVKAIGAGIGVRFWENGAGIVRPSKQRVFFTLGYALTNDTK
jgi:hypothetical protein